MKFYELKIINVLSYFIVTKLFDIKKLEKIFKLILDMCI